MPTKIMNNVVPKNVLRKVQGATLKELSTILEHSFGPNGSNACIKKMDAFSRYSKDGHTIIGSIQYNGIIEQSIKDDIESITRHIVKTVGDGTTSAVILSDLLFETISRMEDDYKPSEVLRALKKVTAEIKENIMKKAKDITLEDVYDIAMISTNGDTFVSEQLRDIYKEFGMHVFIDVTPSTGEDFVIKSYNGMTLNTGYCDPCYVTNAKDNSAEVDRPEVYFFEHPVDTKELGIYLDAILSHNIVEPCNTQNYEKLVPTVIFAPKISQDMSAVMDSIIASMANMPVNNKLPVCVITDYHEVEQLQDLARMCGAKMIRKYIDPKIYEEDVKRGAAPTKETIFDWAGKCDRVVAYSDKTTFINPSKMRDENGEYTEIYNNLVNFLELEIANYIKDGENLRDIGRLKRRLHSLKSNLVELYVGGITQADRDALRDLVEDAVLNIRSAAENGVGLGGNMSAALAVTNLCDSYEDNYNTLEGKLLVAIENAYIKLIDILFGDYVPVSENSTVLRSCIKHAEQGEVYNLREGNWSKNVKTSIMSDIIILETVTKIIGIMATCNQFIVPTAVHNVYVDEEK